MGSGDAGLGKKILGTFFHTLATLDPKPEAIVFYNAGVRLLAPSSPHLDALRALDDQGIELLACVTCLEFFGLVGEIAAGRVTNMREIVQQMLGAGKVVTL
ncbi:MAG: DsrE family protein [Deltaproteobacteria bacterium]|nr:DsrE family protein [Deltaproteobacteria bacterium]